MQVGSVEELPFKVSTIIKSNYSLTAQYLCGKLKIEVLSLKKI